MFPPRAETATGLCEARNPGHIYRLRTTERSSQFLPYLELQPNLAAAFHNLGVTLTEQGRYAEAETACRQSLTLKADYL